MKDTNSLAHSSWNCKYHLVFAPKYRRMEIYGQIRKDIGVILRRLCEQKGIEIIEAELCPDHIYMLVSIPPKYSVASIMGYLKGKSSLMIFDRHANYKYKYGNRHFWCRGYYVDTVGKNKKAIEEYIRKQLQEDIATDQISIKEYIDPFEIELLINGDTLWVTQKTMAEIFDVQRPAIAKHLKNIFEEGELNKNQVCSKMEHTANDGKTYNTEFYNLDAIISVGYRVNSKKATEFRIWATKILKSYMTKGFALDDDRFLKGGKVHQKYFDELLERIKVNGISKNNRYIYDYINRL